MSAHPITADDFDTLPDEMLRARRWLVWRSVPQPDKKPRKVPCYPDGSERRGTLDSPEDQARLGTFADALRALRTGRFAGLGFALGPDGAGGYWQGIDLDDLDKRPHLRDLADELPGYTERSPSGNGVHAIGYGRAFDALGSNASGIEAYAAGRFFTVTAACSGLGGVECLAGFVERRLALLHASRRNKSPASEGVRLDPRTITDLRSALFHLDADDRDTWVRAAHAMKELGDTGRGIWLAWSSTSPKFDGADAVRVWGSCRPSRTGYRAIFGEAKRQGWINPSSNAVRKQGPETGAEIPIPEPEGVPDVPAPSAADPELDSRPFREVELLPASGITPEPIVWLWPGWLAAGKLHVLGGAPGTGKTTIATALAAVISRGGSWPDGTHAVHGTVVIWSGEDDPADTLIPRLMLSGADLSRVHIVGGIREHDTRRAFDPAQDMHALATALEKIGGVRLLIIDPIVSAVAGDSHKNAETRRSLQPIVDLSGKLGCAALGITHFTKGTSGREPVERLTGSLAFGALARVVLVASKRTDDEGIETRVFCRAKSNIGKDDGGFVYDLIKEDVADAPGVAGTRVEWVAPIDGTARELLAEPGEKGRDGGALAEAMEFLLDLLKDGPVPANTVRAEAQDAGHAWATVRRAQEAIGIKPRKSGRVEGWVWQLPETPKMPKNPEDAHPKTVGTFGEAEHLGPRDDFAEVEI